MRVRSRGNVVRVRSLVRSPRMVSVQEKAHFQYDDDGFSLKVPEFNVRPGEVVAIVGRVGGGKTSLLQALLGGMPIKDGVCKVGGRIAYVPQVPNHLVICLACISCEYSNINAFLHVLDEH